ncbi:MAG: DUF488 domain-containing protein [Methyloceanibacter sp.]
MAQWKGRGKATPHAICTIGYEGATIAAFIRTLRQAGVELLLDIRAAPISRKKGFSKHQLAAHLSEAGIAYRHLRGLGTAKRGHDAAHAGDLASFERIFLTHMREPEAVLDLGEAVALAQANAVCLLCLDRDPAHCHRLIVAHRMASKPARTCIICSWSLPPSERKLKPLARAPSLPCGRTGAWLAQTPPRAVAGLCRVASQAG